MLEGYFGIFLSLIWKRMHIFSISSAMVANLRSFHGLKARGMRVNSRMVYLYNWPAENTPKQKAWDSGDSQVHRKRYL